MSCLVCFYPSRDSAHAKRAGTDTRKMNPIKFTWRFSHAHGAMHARPGVLHNKIRERISALARISGAFITFALAHDTCLFSKERYNRMPLHSVHTVRNKNSVASRSLAWYDMYSGLVFWRPSRASVYICEWSYNMSHALCTYACIRPE